MALQKIYKCNDNIPSKTEDGCNYIYLWHRIRNRSPALLQKRDMNSYRAIVLTALREEYLAVRAHLDNLKEETHKGTVYEVGCFSANGRSWDIAIVEVGRHNENASIEAERAINHFNPKVALFVGIAGGLKDVAIGDVVAATKVYGYETGKANDEFQPTPEVYRSSHIMEQRARAVARGADWLGRIKGTIRSLAPKVFAEPIAAGPKVVKSTKSAVYRSLRSNYSDAIAVEMEGLGFLAAAHANQNVYVLVIRGISDLINRKDEADASGSQQVASQNASAFAFEVLATLDFGEESSLQEISSLSSMKKEMDFLIAPLYAKINKNHKIIPFMSTYKISRIREYSDDQERKKLEELEDEIKEIMREYGRLTSDELYSQIDAFLNLKPEWNQYKRLDANRILINISKITKIRYDQLRIIIKEKECSPTLTALNTRSLSTDPNFSKQDEVLKDISGVSGETISNVVGIKMIEMRLEDLEENIRKDLGLLKEYEEEARYASDPREKARICREIERQRESASGYQREYDELRKHMAQEPPGNFVEAIQAQLVALQSGKIDTTTSKVVLILGRFTPERKAVLDAIREELLKRDYLPVMFDFEKSVGRSLTETISLLAHMSRFVIADITDAKSIPAELEHIVPQLPSVPVQPIILKSENRYALFEHISRYPWVLELYRYENQEELLASFGEKVVGPAEAKVNELRNQLK